MIFSRQSSYEERPNLKFVKESVINKCGRCGSMYIFTSLKHDLSYIAWERSADIDFCAHQGRQKTTCAVLMDVVANETKLSQVRTIGMTNGDGEGEGARSKKRKWYI